MNNDITSNNPDRVISAKLLYKNDKNGVDQLLPETVGSQVKLDSGSDLETELTSMKQSSNNGINVVEQLPDTLVEGTVYLDVD